MVNPWLQQYPAHISHQIDISQFSSLPELLHYSCDTYQDNLAYIQPGVPALSFNDVERRSKQFASYLQHQLKIKKGDRVALMSPNLTSFPVAMWGILRAGAVQVSINPLYTPRELEHQLNDADVDTIIIFSPALPTLQSIIENTSIKQVITLGPNELAEAEAPALADGEQPNSTIRFAQALAMGATLPFTPPELTTNDLAFLQYTGGTTGLSKGAMLTHGSIIANILQYQEMGKGNIAHGEDVLITAIPMYHIFALMANTLSYFLFGAKNILIANPRDMPAFVEVWQEYKPTMFTGVNTLFNGLLHTPGFADVDFSNLKLVIGGGAAVQQAVAKKWRQVTGVPLHEGFGLSETSPIVTLNLTGTKIGIGIPLPLTDVSIRDDNGEPLAQGQSGELCTKGPQVMLGYWRNPEATKEVMTQDGYFKTGDIAYMDESGFFHIVDRKKDMILVSGFNVFPNEIEAEVAKMPGIIECACIGVNDDTTGEAVKLFAVRAEESIQAQDVIEFCRQTLTAYKVPKQVQFISEVPKSAVGKILRRALR